MKGVVLLLLLGASLPSARAADAAKPTSEIESLLSEAEGALLGKRAPRESAPVSKRKEKEPTSPAANAAVAPENQPAAIPQLSPIDTTAIQRVIAVDLEATHREREPLYPVTLVSLSVGAQGLNRGYVLSKDDDRFTNPERGNLGGVYATFSPMWKLGFLEYANFRPFVSVVFGTGYSQGEVLMRRTGVQSGEQRYRLKLFPVEAGLEFTLELFRRAGIALGYGPALEVLHQDGVGKSDSITEFFYGDQVWLGLNAKISDSMRVFLQYKRRGTNLLLRSPSFGGELISAGLAFGLSG